ncbi:MAG: antitoxin [bacterium]|nr:antitoxin [bacterium]
MPQLSLYIDDATMGLMKRNASAEGVSLSRYAANAIREYIDAPKRVADDDYWDKLYGCLADDDSFGYPERYESDPIPALDL